MKIREGFVSNSSSTSFCIYGTTLQYKKELSEEAECAGLEYHHPDSSDIVFIGRSWSSIGDDETGAMFKESVEKAIMELCGIKKQCHTYEESWYSG
jgi:hypothetical protein